MSEQAVIGVMAGRQIGQFTIQSLLGAGGMGEVYLARDSRLEREVAIKFLPLAAVATPPQRARFEREARLLASLNHPNIAQVHGLEDLGGVQALVMEYVPGETLGAAIRRTSQPMPVARALTIARQIAEAIDAAHGSGILHRDLKPGNIAIRPDGMVKVLDFGLAKVVTGEGSQASGLPQASTVTASGMILGTAPYMSPEHARGLPVDRRTDIWAFGCILFEMLTGRAAFEGPTLADTLAAIVDREPHWGTLPAALPWRVRELLQRCLVKDPSRRLRDIGDALPVLDSPGPSAPESAAVSAHRLRRRDLLWTALGAGITLGLIALSFPGLFQTPPSPEPVSFTIFPPAKHAFLPLTGSLALSPDGRKLAFVTTSEGRNHLWVRSLDAVAPRLLTDADHVWQPSWSPDSRSLLFIESFSGGRLRRVDLDGAPAMTIADWSMSSASWGSGGSILFTGRDGRLYRVPDRGGEPAPVLELDAGRQELMHVAPRFLPDGQRFIFQALSQDAAKHARFIGSLDATRRHLQDGLSNVDYADGYAVYHRDGTLFAHRFDERAGTFTGEATPVVENILTHERGPSAFSLAGNGTLAFRTAGASSPTLAWFDREGKRLGGIGGIAPYEHPRFSADGRWLAVSRREGNQSDIWVIDVDRNIPRRLTTDPSIDDYPVWSRDGRHVIFTSNRKGIYDLYRRAADGGGSDELLFASTHTKRPTDVGTGVLVFTMRTGPGQSALDIWGMTPAEGAKPYPILATPGLSEYNGVLSPDGRWLAYTSGESPAPRVFVQPLPATGRRIPVSSSTAAFPQWSTDGSQIFYNTLSQLSVADMRTPDHPGVPVELFPWPWRDSWTVDRTGQRFLRTVGGDVDAEEPITVVVNWTSTLRKQ